MAQLYFKFGAMGSSKTANALMARFNYEERGQETLLVKPRLDTRDGDHMICYGLRADFKGDLFPGSYHLLVLADKLEEVKTICWCGKKAAFNARFDENGHVVKEGAQVVLGANDKYIGLCRRHWMAGDLGPDFDIHKV